MTKQEKLQREFAEQLTRSISMTFRKAYLMRFLGASEAELLIDFDIQAAASDTDPAIIITGRSTIKAAARAVDDRIPFPEAHAHIMQHVRTHTDQIITDNFKKKKRSRA